MRLAVRRAMAPRPGLPSSTRAALAARSAFTFIEVLMTVSILVVLMGLLLPVLSIVREQVHRTRAREQIAEIHMALQHYASEERRHRYPTQSDDLSLRYDPTRATIENLNALIQGGYQIDMTTIDRSVSPQVMLDPWKRPYRYQVDSDLFTLPGAQRPKDSTICPAWNSKGVRPFGYVWSLGKKGQDDGSQWIYQKDTQ